MKIPQVIPYQGSKRHIAKYILCFFPHQVDFLVEPFAGSAAISIAAACQGKASSFHINDINKPLMMLWKEIINNPQEIADNYERLWNEQQGREREFYDMVRDEFNKTRKPEQLLYLMARCVKASMRYNSKGNFNQSPDNRRKGRMPNKMREDIFATSHLLRNRTMITNKDYSEILANVSEEKMIYMDPPYQGVCTKKDPRYYCGINLDKFIFELEDLNNRQILFILSYDGRRGQKEYGIDLSLELDLYRIEVKAGRSTQSTLLGENDVTYESIYLSKALINKFDDSLENIINKCFPKSNIQCRLPFVSV